MPSAVVLTGNIFLDWNERILALMRVSCVSFASVWCKGEPSHSCSTRYSLCVNSEAGGSARQRQRTDSTHVLAKIRAINRLMCVGEAMRFAPPQSRCCRPRVACVLQ